MRTDTTHIGESERWLSVIVGGMLALSSLRRRDLGTGALFALGGSALIFRGITGRNDFLETVANALDRQLRGAGSGARHVPRDVAEPDSDAAVGEVDEASMESFPASDPPSFTATAGAQADGDVGDEDEER